MWEYYAKCYCRKIVLYDYPHLSRNLAMFFYCTYHIVWAHKYRYRVLESLVKDLLSKDIPMLLEWKSSEMIEMNIRKDYVLLIVSVPPKVSISQLMGF